MKNLLKEFYSEGQPLHKAINLCLSIYGRTPSKKIISAVRKEIKDSTGFNWTIEGDDMGAVMLRSIHL